jgi:hypothetical protein
MWQCSQHHENRDGAKFCAKCGEKRIENVVCSACATTLEPEDEFCTSCGLKRGGQPAAPPIESHVVEAAAPPAAPPPAPAAASAPAAEPFRFNFGGAVIEASDEPKKPKKSAKSPMTTAALSFVLFAVLLVIALYLASR